MLFGLKSKNLSIGGCVYSFIILFTCYGIAVSLGHVPIIAIISDCGAQAPEMYLFRFGLVSSAVMLNMNSYLVVSILDQITTLDSVGLVTTTIGCIGLGGLASVSVKEDVGLHGVFAAMFFGCYLFYMIGVLYRFYPYFKQGKITQKSMSIKTFLTVIAFICASGFLYFNANGGNTVWYSQIAIVEWAGVISIISFSMSFCYEYGNTQEMATVDVNTPNDPFFYNKKFTPVYPTNAIPLYQYQPMVMN